MRGVFRKCRQIRSTILGESTSTCHKNSPAFLWGARKTGKSTYLKQRFPESVCIDLLRSDTF
jgi:hypothetical protein